MVKPELDLGHGVVSVQIGMVWVEANEHWIAQNTKRVNGIQRYAEVKWRPPQIGWIKVNVNAPFIDGLAFAAAVFRNHDGSLVYAHTAKRWCHDPSTTKAFALREAASILDGFKINLAILESNCLQVVKIVKNRDETLDWMIKFVSRVANEVAHNLVAWVRIGDRVDFCDPNELPSNVFCNAEFSFIDSFAILN
ncbi:hypothetical protein CDL12_16718 [Handroanthus impetiginosus]|uniref:RNase H type-1 domain-containing protein n=1 Tax=Handroanthus impetiginosus TaxID=429701 RepID=A0A2G9GZI3_9LAMI|nr:hypothetical protein CDL12_16718 [Handroanthus impetiginosus]